MRRGLLALIAAPVFYVLAGFLGALSPGHVTAVGGAPTARIGLARGPLHYDLLLPLTDDSRAAFGFLDDGGLPVYDRRAIWLVVGWGAEAFYTSVERYSDVTAPVLWRAVTGDDPVLRFDLAGDVSGVSGLEWIDASPAQITALQAAILRQVSRDYQGVAIRLPPVSAGQTHLFYRANGRFDLFHTCNDWIGARLRDAGLPFGAWTPTTQAVALSLWWHGD